MIMAIPNKPLLLMKISNKPFMFAAIHDHNQTIAIGNQFMVLIINNYSLVKYQP